MSSLPYMPDSRADSITVRALNANDRQLVAVIVREVGNFTEDEIDCALELVDIYLKDEKQDDYRLVGAAVDGETIQAYVCWGPTPLTRGTYDLYWIATHPDAQQRGLGQALMAYVEGKVQAEGGRLLVVETASKDSYRATTEFYRKLGYQQTSIIRDFYDVGDDKLILTKRFPG